MHQPAGGFITPKAEPIEKEVNWTRQRDEIGFEWDSIRMISETEEKSELKSI